MATREPVTAFGPGRVNLIGEHTDYNGGLEPPVRHRRGRHGHRHAARRRPVEARARRPRRGRPLPARRPRRGDRDGWRAFVRGTVAELPPPGTTLAPARLEISGDVPGAPACRRRPRSRSRSRSRCSGREPEPTASRSRGCARAWRTSGSARRPACSTSSRRCFGRAGTRCASTSPRSTIAPVPLRPRRLDAGDARLRRARTSSASAATTSAARSARAACALLGVETLSDGRRRRRRARCPSRWTAAPGTCSRRTPASTRRSLRCTPATSAGSGACSTPATPACATSTTRRRPRSRRPSRA